MHQAEDVLGVQVDRSPARGLSDITVRKASSQGTDGNGERAGETENVSRAELKKRVGPVRAAGAVTLKGDNNTQGGGLERGRPRASSVAKGDQRTELAVQEETKGEEKVNGAPTTRFRVAGTRKVQQQWLLILRGYARAPGPQGKLQPVEIRALLDSGAEGDFMSPSLATKLGGQLEEGKFGFALGVFGEERPINKQARDLHIELRGAQAGSGLGQDFRTQHTVLVAPTELGTMYNMLLGAPFLEKHHATLGYGKRAGIELTAQDGTTTSFPVEARAACEKEEEHIETEDDEAEHWNAQERQEVARRKVHAIRRPLSGNRKRELRREQRWWIEEGRKMAELARAQRPDLVMTTDELEACWNSSAPNTVKIFPIVCTGQVGQERGAQPAESSSAPGQKFRIARVARGASTDTETETKDEQGALPATERAAAERMRAGLVKDFPTVFTDDLPKLDELRTDKDGGVDIVLKDGARPAGRYGPRMTQEDTVLAAKMIQELLEKGFIRPSKSPWGAPMFLVDKPDGSKRMVIDYRALNSATVRNRYPLPRTDELFDQLQGARYFSKIDLRTGYWQIRMAASAVEKTAFTSRHGHFEWLVLPMGLTNAPAEFMAMMEDTFRQELNKFILVFLDDILIYSRTLEEHDQHLRAAMEKLRARKLHAKISKCQFFRAEVEFLGHYVGRAGVRMVEGKVAAVQQWPVPAKQKDVEQFLGLSGYYRRFIKDFSKIASPLSALCGTLKKGEKGARKEPPKKVFHWGDEEQRAFNTLKAAVASAPCLAMPDPNKEFIVHTDASGYATGAVLMQQYEGGLRPVAFLSKKMKGAEMNYPVHEQELLAILNALRAWRHYLGGRRFTVLTDHQSLQYVESSAMATPRQMRWATLMSEFDFAIKYTPGDKNVAADALSRGAAGGAPPEEVEAEATGERLLVNRIATIAPMPVRVRAAAEMDDDYQAILACSSEYLRTKKLAKADGLLYRATGYEDSGQLVVPANQNLRAWMLSWSHDAVESGHRGAQRMYEWLRTRVWWPGMQADAEKYARGCESCQQNKPDVQGRQGMPLSIDTPTRAGEVICMDFIGPFIPSGREKWDSIMVVVDKLTRYCMYIPMRTTSAAPEVFHALDQRWMAIFGAPSVIISDRDSKFTSRFWERMWEGLRVELKRSTSFHPQTDGTTERQNRTLVEALKSFVNDTRDDWALLLPQLQRAANSSISASTGFSPDRMMFGREMRAGLDADLEQDGVAPRGRHPGAIELERRREQADAAAREQIEKAQAKQRKDMEKGRREGDIKVGDFVWLSKKNLKRDGPQGNRKLEPIYWGPYEVLEMHHSNAARIRLPQGCRLHPVFNLDLLKKWVDGTEEFPDRPARHERPGPVAVPEEDPEAGGPGEPEYEVAEIIGVRGSGARKEYKLLWEGWPREQASWEKAANCDNCAHLVEEFERRQLEARRRVQQVHLTEIRRQEAELQKWSILAAAARRGRVAEQPTAEQLQQREEHKRADEINLPVRADRPPVDSKGQIDMGAQRCVENTKAGCWCKLHTRHGCLCWIHRVARDGLQIRKSTVPNAGLGLFARRAFKKGEIVARYTGDLIETQAGEEHRDGFGGSKYVLEMSERVSVDAARTNTADGRMCNDPRGSGKRANVKFSVNQQTKTATVRAKRAIAAGEELLLSYGRGFWTAQGDQAPQTAKKRGVPEATAAKRAPVVEAATGDSADDPIVVSALGTNTSLPRYRINMMKMFDCFSPPKGIWIDHGEWMCACRRGILVHAAEVGSCRSCGFHRPRRAGRPSPPPTAAAAAVSAPDPQTRQLGDTATRGLQGSTGSRSIGSRSLLEVRRPPVETEAEQKEREQKQQGETTASAHTGGVLGVHRLGATAQATTATATPSWLTSGALPFGGAGQTVTQVTTAATASGWTLGAPRFGGTPQMAAGSGMATAAIPRGMAAGGALHFVSGAQAVTGSAVPPPSNEMAARRAAWERAAALTQEERRANPSVRRDPGGRHVGGRAPMGVEPPATGDCRGLASKYVPHQCAHRVSRVRERHAGYCKREFCECCAPTAEPVGNTGAFQQYIYCSCLAVSDGLCKRCWLDHYYGMASSGGQYWGP